MFFSLVQTLVCVLLINGGLYALHLNGNSGGGSGGRENIDHQMQQHQLSPQQPQHNSPVGTNRMLHTLVGQQPPGQHHPPPSMTQHQKQHPHRSAAAAAFDATTGRLNQEIADMAQLERERLMLLGLAKQTAENPVAPAGHHGRPIIAGRIQMQPSDDVDVADYPGLLQQAARGLMFGNVVKQPPSPLLTEDDYEEVREFGRRPVKYDYGRVVQPSDREQEQQQQQKQQAAAALYESQQGFGDFDDFMELESMGTHGGGEDDLLSELDGYQYQGWEDDAPPAHSIPENPYRTLEQLELAAPAALQQLFDQEQQDAPAKQHEGKPRNYNIRAEQKWARKRGHVGGNQPELQRNIFRQHFKQQSEAAANKNPNPITGQVTTRSGSSSSSSAMSTSSDLSNASVNSPLSLKDKTGKEASESTHQEQQQKSKKPQDPTRDDPQHQSKSKQQQQEQQQLLLPNHKRSGGISTTSGGYALPPASHSIANQLMLRTARGQRQYDVPQIECPTAMDGMERFACPTPDLQGRYRCIDDHVLCDGFIDCPEGEDEDRRSCMFYKTTKAHLDVLADALLRWARGR